MHCISLAFYIDGQFAWLSFDITLQVEIIQYFLLRLEHKRDSHFAVGAYSTYKIKRKGLLKFIIIIVKLQK